MGETVLWDSSPPSSQSADFLNTISIPCPNNSRHDLLVCHVAGSTSLDLVTRSPRGSRAPAWPPGPYTSGPYICNSTCVSFAPVHQPAPALNFKPLGHWGLSLNSSSLHPEFENTIGVYWSPTVTVILRNKAPKCFPGGSDGNKICLQCRRPRLGKSPGRRHGNSLQYSCLENSHGQRSPRGCKESDTAE